MGAVMAEQRELSGKMLEYLLRKMRQHSTNWSHIDSCLRRAFDSGAAHKERCRTARPFENREPLAATIDAPTLDCADLIVIATDGSQVIANHHDPYLYYLTNIGGIVYYQGGQQTAEPFTQPALYYVNDAFGTTENDIDQTAVYARRDNQEIKLLVQKAREVKARFADRRVLGILDQRLSYRPIRLADQKQADIYLLEWIDQIAEISAIGAAIVGYISPPQTWSITTLLDILDFDEPNKKHTSYNEIPLVRDNVLFDALLNAGQRSCLFESVDHSKLYRKYEARGQEICFFYYKAPNGRDVARVDIPKWAASQPDFVHTVHALIHQQCQILGGYPYVLTRADEEAVVLQQDHEYLNHMIELEMRRRKVAAQSSGKRQGKDDTRTGKTRHAIY
jgi:hypothetical protein